MVNWSNLGSGQIAPGQNYVISTKQISDSEILKI